MASVFPPALSELITALQCLPGVGPKSAQRAAFQLLERDRDGAQRLSRALAQVVSSLGHCPRCRMFSEAGSICQICADARRDTTALVVVENPADIVAIENATDYRGMYFVLMGRLSPLDGIGPVQLGAQQLESRFDAAVEEVIIATGATIEGEATAHWVGEMARRHGVHVTRIAHGVPVGGDLDYVDGMTLARAFNGRREIFQN